jgi:hypothetical protein
VIPSRDRAGIVVAEIPEALDLDRTQDMSDREAGVGTIAHLQDDRALVLEQRFLTDQLEAS